jgi:transposase
LKLTDIQVIGDSGVAVSRVPGIGGITAVAVISEPGDLRRFSTLDELASGLYESSDKSQCLGPSKRSNRELRSLLIESSWVAVGKDMALQQYYRKHAHKEPNKAIIKVAHKLLSRIRAVITTGIPYQFAVVKQKL